MRFMILVKATKDTEAGIMPPARRWTLMGAMAAFHEELAKAGVLLDGSGLQPSAKGWRIRYHGEKRTIIDGPFAEAKELVAGYTLIQAKSKEEASNGHAVSPILPAKARKPRSRSGNSTSWRILSRAKARALPRDGAGEVYSAIARRSRRAARKKSRVGVSISRIRRSS